MALIGLIGPGLKVGHASACIQQQYLYIGTSERIYSTTIRCRVMKFGEIHPLGKAFQNVKFEAHQRNVKFTPRAWPRGAKMGKMSGSLIGFIFIHF